MKEIQTPAGNLKQLTETVYALKVANTLESLSPYELAQACKNSINFIFEPICFASQATEEQAKGIVEITEQVGGTNYYRDYGVSLPLTLGTSALESLQSLMTKNECYLENPSGHEPDESEYERYTNYLDDFEYWQQAEENTGEWLILTEKK